MHVIVTCKCGKEWMNWMKNSREKVETPFFPSSGERLWHSMAVPLFETRRRPCILSVTMEISGRIKPNVKLIQALMYVIITCKYEKDPIKNSREKVETSFSLYKHMGILSDVKGQLTLQSVVKSGRNSSSHACPHYLQV